MAGYKISHIVLSLLGAIILPIFITVYGDLLYDPPGFETEETSLTTASKASQPTAEVAEAKRVLADHEFGAALFRKKCAACHTPNEGGANKVGPNLWGIVDDDMARTSGFRYSSGLAAKGDKWTTENLDLFLTKPKIFIAKTRMSFPGLKKEKDRAYIIAYLRNQGG